MAFAGGRIGEEFGGAEGKMWGQIAGGVAGGLTNAALAWRGARKAAIMGAPELRGTQGALGGRELKMPTQGNLAKNVFGKTDWEGNITIQRGLSRAMQRATLLHESVHRTLTARSGPLVAFRQWLTQVGYHHSHLLRGTEEMLAQGYAVYATTGSARHAMARGFMYPFLVGDAAPVRYALEAIGYAGLVSAAPLGAYYY